LRSSLSFVRAAYHSHCRACSKHSSMVGDMDLSSGCWRGPKGTPSRYARGSGDLTPHCPGRAVPGQSVSNQYAGCETSPHSVASRPAGGNSIGSSRVI
jgi:hypothetical protein